MEKKPRQRRLPLPMHRRPEDQTEPQVRDARPDLAGSDWREKVEAKLQLLPKQPGVYLLRDRHGRVLYVGKEESP
ncbi:MAG: hypothetical protein R3E12_10535 [Candidatus Eisenbacteria bacterium]